MLAFVQRPQDDESVNKLQKCFDVDSVVAALIHDYLDTSRHW